MKKHLEKVSWYILLTLSVVVIFVTVALSALRIALPYMSDYAQQIEVRLEEEIGHQISMGNLDTDWDWFSPRLIVTDVNVYQKDRKTIFFHFDNIYVKFSLWRNLLKLDFKPYDITLEGSQFELERRKDGTLLLQGVPVAAGTGDGSNELIKKLLVDRRYQLVHSRFTWKDASAVHKSLAFDIDNLLVESSARNLNAHLIAVMPSVLGKEIDIVLKSENHGQWKVWDSQLYIRGHKLKLAALMEYLDQDYLELAGESDIELWAGLENNKIVSMEGKLLGQDINVARKMVAREKKNYWKLNRIGSEFVLKKKNQLWQLVLNQFSIQMNGYNWKNSHIDIVYDPVVRSFGLKSNYLNLKFISHMLDQLQLAEQLPFLKQIEPVGVLQDTDIVLPDWSDPAGWRLKSRFKSLGANIKNKDMRIDGLDGKISVNGREGFVEVKSPQVNLAWNAIRSNVVLQGFNTKLLLKPVQNGFRVSTDLLSAELDLVRLNSRFSLDVTDNPFLDMHWRTGAVDTAWAKKYMPEKIMGKKTVSWLKSAIRHGDTKQVDVLYFGHIKEFPFANAEGVAQVVLDVKNGTLKYQPNWPEINQLNAHFLYENKMIEISDGEGKIGTADLYDVITRISLGKKPRVDVDGQVKTSSINLERFFEATPIVKYYNKVGDQITVRGMLDAELQLGIPLTKNTQVDVAGKVRLNGNSLKVKHTDYRFSDLEGQVAFKNLELSSQGLRARLDGNAVKATIEEGLYNGVAATHIKADMVAGLNEVIPFKDDFSSLYKDKTHWHGELFIPHKKHQGVADTEIRVSSDLSGMALLLPDALHKNKKDKVAFNFSLLNQNGQKSLVSSYGDRINTSLKWMTLDDLSGQVNIFSDEPRSVADGVGVSANLKLVDVTQWQQVFKPFIKDKQADSDILKRIAVKTDAIKYEKFIFQNVDLEMTKAPVSWDVKLSSDRVKAYGQIPLDWSGNDAININIEKLNMASEEEPPATDKQPVLKADAASGSEWISPGKIPPLKLVATNVRYKQYDFKTVRLETSRNHRYGMNVHLLELNGDNVKIKSNGRWSQSSRGTSYSSFRFEIGSENIGAMLSNNGFTNSMRNGEGNAVVEWSWSGAPYDFNWKSLKGKMNLVVRNGRFIDIEPGAGRLLGMFSLSSLPSRFMLDFSDTFSKGFEFNKLSSEANFADGQFYTSNTAINGSAADIYFSGRIGLIDRDYDQVMSVVPRISSGVSGWLAVLEGAAVGITAYIGQKLLGVDDANKDQYHITGPWSDPKIVELKEVVEKTNSDPFESED